MSTDLIGASNAEWLEELLGLEELLKWPKGGDLKRSLEMAKRLRKVAALHIPLVVNLTGDLGLQAKICKECTRGVVAVEWPCQTTHALEGDLAGDEE